MRKYLNSTFDPFLLLKVALLAACLPFALRGDGPSGEVAELMPRGGLPNFFEKLERGDSVTIAYLGGSITAQRGWRVQSREWLQSRFPEAKIGEIHAAVGGTGSSLGVFRVEADALEGRPDLLFVEFAVNDSRTDPDDIRKAMEGIVRKTRTLLPETDICFVYTVTARDTPSLAAGELKRSERVMEEVADHYGIPTIHLGVEIARLERVGELVMQSGEALVTRVSGEELDASADLATDGEGRIVFSRDGVHPYPETGHVLYTRALTRSLEQLEGVGQPGAHVVGAPMGEDNWEKAHRVLIEAGQVSGPVARLDPAVDRLARSFGNRLGALWKFEPGASLSFRFRGTKVALYDLLGPEGAMLEVTVNGESREVVRFDGFCTYNRLSYLAIADNLPEGLHEVRITVIGEVVDKERRLLERNRNDFAKNLEKYAPTHWYAGSILIVGDGVE